LNNKLNGLAYREMLYIAPLVVCAARVQKELHRDLENPATKQQRPFFIFNIKPKAKYAPNLQVFAATNLSV
jgi:hypothetical protein